MLLCELPLNKAEGFLKLLNEIPQMMILFPVFFLKLPHRILQGT